MIWQAEFVPARPPTKITKPLEVLIPGTVLTQSYRPYRTGRLFITVPWQ